MKLRVLGCFVVFLLFALLVVGCQPGGAQQETYETQEPTPFEVYMGKGHLGGPVRTHYLLPEHQDVILALDTITSFIQVDLTQSWQQLNWNDLQPLVVSPLDPSRRELAEGYRSNKLETRVENLDIKQIVYSGDSQMPGYPLFRASVAGTVTIVYLSADPKWLEQYNVVLNRDYTFDMDISLTKLVSPNARQAEIGDTWRISFVRYEVIPSERPPIR